MPEYSQTTKSLISVGLFVATIFSLVAFIWYTTTLKAAIDKEQQARMLSNIAFLAALDPKKATEPGFLKAMNTVLISDNETNDVTGREQSIAMLAAMDPKKATDPEILAAMNRTLLAGGPANPAVTMNDKAFMKATFTGGGYGAASEPAPYSEAAEISKMLGSTDHDDDGMASQKAFRTGKAEAAAPPTGGANRRMRLNSMRDTFTDPDSDLQ